jgi:hypothetical protein
MGLGGEGFAFAYIAGGAAHHSSVVYADVGGPVVFFARFTFLIGYVLHCGGDESAGLA